MSLIKPKKLSDWPPKSGKITLINNQNQVGKSIVKAKAEAEAKASEKTKAETKAETKTETKTKAETKVKSTAKNGEWETIYGNKNDSFDAAVLAD